MIDNLAKLLKYLSVSTPHRCSLDFFMSKPAWDFDFCHMCHFLEYWSPIRKKKPLLSSLDLYKKSFEACIKFTSERAAVHI